MTQREKMYLGILMGVLTILQHACPEVGYHWRHDEVPDESECEMPITRYGSWETPFMYWGEIRFSYSIVRCPQRDELGL